MADGPVLRSKPLGGVDRPPHLELELASNVMNVTQLTFFCRNVTSGEHKVTKLTALFVQPTKHYKWVSLIKNSYHDDDDELD